MRDSSGRYEHWMSAYQSAYSSPNQLSMMMRCPNCEANELNLVYVIYGSDPSQGHGAFWCDACREGLALGPAPVPADGVTVNLAEVDIPGFRIVPPPGRGMPSSE